MYMPISYEMESNAHVHQLTVSLYHFIHEYKTFALTLSVMAK